MAKYAVAFISFMDNVLTQEVVEATNEYSAIEGYMLSKGIEIYDDHKSVESLKELAFDCDCMVSAIKVLPDGWSFTE